MRALGFTRRVLNLQRLPRLFGQGLVICGLQHQGGHIAAEALLQLLCSHAGILNGVVQESGRHQVRVQDRTAGGDQLRNFDQMIDVGFCGLAFAFLGDMFLGGEVCCCQDFLRVRGRLVVVRHVPLPYKTMMEN